MSRRSGQRRGRPLRAGAGNSGASCVHSASVRSHGESQATDAGEHGMRALFSARHWWAASCPIRGQGHMAVMVGDERGGDKGGHRGLSKCYKA
jgi:hypothetical protein